VVEGSYVGTRGRNLVSRINGNVMPYGILNSGTFNGIDLGNIVNRYAVGSDTANLGTFRPFNAFSGSGTGCGGSVPLCIYNYNGVSDYDSLQVTLSRQTGRRLQYFMSYTLGRNRGTWAASTARATPMIRAAPTACCPRTARTR